jgi:hypothetical protein
MISTLTLTGPPEDADATLQWAPGTCQHQRIAFPLTIHPYFADAAGNLSETLPDEIGFDRHATFTERARTVHARLGADLDHRHHSGIEVPRGGNGMLASQFKLRRRRIAEASLKGTARNGS